MAYDQFVEPIGNKGLLHFGALQFTHALNLARKPGTPTFDTEDVQPWSRKSQIQQTGEFASREEALAYLNGGA